MCVATARTQDALDALFGSRGIWDYFSYFGCSTSRQERPNKADSIRRCAQHMGVPPEQCLMIGDRYVDIRGAREAGAMACGVTYGFGSRAELEAEAPQYLVDSVEELSGLLLGGK